MYTSCSSCGSIEDANKVFDVGSPSKNVYAWNTLLKGNVVSGRKQYREMLSTFSKMRELGIELNVYTFSCLIKSLAGGSTFMQRLKTHALLIKNGFVNSGILGTRLMDMYFKCGKVKLARRLFEEIPDRHVVVWGVMIAGFAHNRLLREALKYTREIVREGMETNLVLATILPVIRRIVC